LSLSKSNPHLALEWHDTYNKGQFDDFTSGSNKKAWWICKVNNEHEWKAAISSRVLKGTGCPYCSGNKVNHTNNLTKIYPSLAKEWHPTKNDGNEPDTVFCRSTKQVWWKCDEGFDHEWRDSPRARAKKKVRCLFCDGRKLSVTNSLEKKFPRIAKEWHAEKNRDLTPADVTFKDTKKVWWKCNEGSDHEWKATVADRIAHPKCVFCTGKRVSITNSLASKYPKIAAEWDYELNSPLKPDQVTFGSHKIVTWRCAFDPKHSWPARINSRTTATQMNGCRICGARQKSAPELRVLAELGTIFDDVLYRERIEKTEIDIFIPSLAIGIEYDGSYYHRNKLNLDRNKNDFFSQRSISIIRFRRSPLERVSPVDIIVQKDELSKTDIDALLYIIKDICSDNQKHTIDCYLDKKTFQNNAMYNKYLSEFPKPIFEKSLKALHPEISSEWHYEKNQPLEPSHFTPGSDQIVYWLCKQNPKHVWPAGISHRTNEKKPTGCPFCFGKGPHLRVNNDNSFKAVFPLSVKEWHPTKNGNLDIDEVSYGSGVTGHWLCSQCGNDFQRVVRKHKMPGCSQKCRNIIKRLEKLTTIE